MKSLGRHTFCLLLLLLAHPYPSDQSTSDEDSAPSIARLDTVYPLALRNRTRMMEVIAAAPALVNFSERGEADDPPLWSDLDAESSRDFQTDLRLIYFHMSLQL